MAESDATIVAMLIDMRAEMSRLFGEVMRQFRNVDRRFKRVERRFDELEAGIENIRHRRRSVLGRIAGPGDRNEPFA
jgi:hypothetical protein